MGVGMMSVNLMKFRQMQQANAYTSGALRPGVYDIASRRRIAGSSNFGYKARSMFGYTSTIDELEAWNTGRSSFMGGAVAKATRVVSNPLLGAQMVHHGERMLSSAAFAGTRDIATKYGISAATNMTGDNLGVWLTEAMVKQGGKVATGNSIGGIYNRAFAKFMGVSGAIEKGATNLATKKVGKEAAEEALEFVAEKAGARLAVKGVGASGAAGAKLVGYVMPGVNTALMAWDIGTLAYHGFTGAAKIGEAVHYKIPKAYFQKSMKTFMRPRFEAIGPASVMNPENMNNRMRAVQAIQGSKLNARSALGNEAGLLHGHFG
jgi:hypothetical protein